MKKNLIRFVRWSGILILLLFCVWGAFALYWQTRGSRELKEARTELVALGEPMEASEVIPKLIPDEENAAFLLNRIRELTGTITVNHNRETENPDLHWGSGVQRKFSVLTFVKEASPQVVERCRKDMEIYQESLSLIDQALQKPGYRFDYHYENGPFMASPNLGTMRFATRLLVERAFLQELDGNASQAADTLLSCNKLGLFLNSEPMLISALVEVAIDAIFEMPLTHLITSGQLDDVQLQKIQQTLEGKDYRIRFLKAQQGERCLMIDWFFSRLVNRTIEQKNLDIFFAPTNVVVSSFEEEVKIHASFRAWAMIHLVPSGFWKSDWAISLHYLASIVKESKSEILNSHPCEPNFPKRAVMTKMLTPALGRLDVSMGRAQATRELVCLACALQRYQLANKRYPEKLADLKSLYLPKIPTDPFSGEEPHYKSDGKNYLIYFFGDDRVDNQGDGTRFKDISLATDPSWLPVQPK